MVGCFAFYVTILSFKSTLSSFFIIVFFRYASFVEICTPDRYFRVCLPGAPKVLSTPSADCTGNEKQGARVSTTCHPMAKVVIAFYSYRAAGADSISVVSWLAISHISRQNDAINRPSQFTFKCFLKYLYLIICCVRKTDSNVYLAGIIAMWYHCDPFYRQAAQGFQSGFTLCPDVELVDLYDIHNKQLIFLICNTIAN